MSGSIAGILGFLKLDPATMPEVAGFTLRMVIFCVPFLLLGLYLERGVDGRERIPRARRLVKMAVLSAGILPFCFLGGMNLVNALRPELLARVMEKNPDLQNLMVMDGLVSPLVLLGVLLVFFFLAASEILGGDTSR